ncbi:MAG: c-type cytochrome [Epsilonproteobacteria bacterium]|nr:c-type cytochrome [Campylobacterota bacterium]
MKKILSTVIAVGLMGSASLTAATIEAKKSGDLNKITPVSKEWMAAKASEVILYPQTTLKMNDKEANVLNKDNKAKKAMVRALYSGSEIAFLIEWPDGTKSVQQGYKSATYADGFAVQFASKTVVGELPYVGMGSKGREAVIHLQKAVEKTYEPNGNGDVSMQVSRKQTNAFGDDLKAFDKKVDELANRDYQRVFIGEGFRSMTEIKGEDLKSTADMEHTGKTWKGSLVRPLKDDYMDASGDATAVVFAVWDGDKKNRDGLKLLSSWTAVSMGAAADNALLLSLDDKVEGDVKRGKELAEMNCASCHQYTGAEMAPAYMAPNLSNIGGYSTAAYLIESIVEPNAVVVPGYNRNAHKNFEWYMVDDKGNRTSTMPPFGHLEQKDLMDIVAFFKTMKAEVE